MKKMFWAFLAALGFGSIVFAAVQQSPTKGSGGTVIGRTAAVDGNGNIYSHPGFLGYKVFEDSNSSTAVFITDELGNKPTCGLIHQVCLPVQTENTGAPALNEYVQVTETAVIFSGRQGGNVVPRTYATTATLGAVNVNPVCIIYEAQFNNTVQVWDSGTDLDAIVYWAPCQQANDR